MKTLVVARHGAYTYRDGEYHLSDFGRDQIELLAGALETTINGQSVALLTSTAPRAKESAEVLGKKIDVEPQEHELLRSEGGRPMDIDGVIALIQEHENFDIVIIMTHYEYSEFLPRPFAEKVLGTTDGFPRYATNKGEAWVVDCDARTCSCL